MRSRYVLRCVTASADLFTLQVRLSTRILPPPLPSPIARLSSLSLSLSGLARGRN
jgi:hypothetical protein